MRSLPTLRRRRRVGCVTVYQRSKRFWIYYRQGGQPVRMPVGPQQDEALRVAAKVNAELAEGARPSLQFRPITIDVLVHQWLDQHEHIRRSSLATVRRYRTAVLHLTDFLAARHGLLRVDRFDASMAEQFVRYLRGVQVAPNGHPHAARRPLRDKGVIFILETCRALFSFAARQRHLPAYAPNPFSGLSIERMPIEDAKPIRPLTQPQEVAFFQACDAWQFPIFFVLAFTGLRVGELTHLLIDHGVDLDAGILRVLNKPGLGWQVKTRNVRDVPLLPEVATIMQGGMRGRHAGPVFLRRRFTKGWDLPLLVGRSVLELEQEVVRRTATSQAAAPSPLSRAEVARIARSVWLDAGGIKETTIRGEFMKVTTKIGLAHLTCPKDLRHLFATSLQVAGVDPMIRRDVMGHTTLEMTSHYTHTQNGTRLRELHRLDEVRGEVLNLARLRLAESGQCGSEACLEETRV